MWCLETILAINQELALGKTNEEVYDILGIAKIDPGETLRLKEYCENYPENKVRMDNLS